MRSLEENASNANVGYMPGTRRENRETRGEEEGDGGDAKGDGGNESFYDSSAAVSEVARRNKADFHDGIMTGRNMCIGSLRAR